MGTFSLLTIIHVYGTSCKTNPYRGIKIVKLITEIRMLHTPENSCNYHAFRQNLAHHHAVNCLPLSPLDFGFELNVLYM